MTFNKSDSITGKNPLPVGVSVAGVAIDAVLLYALIKGGLAADVSAMISLVVAFGGVCLLGARAVIGSTAEPGFRHIGRVALVVLLVVFLRAGILAWMVRIPGCPLVITAAVAAAAAGVLIRVAMAIDPAFEDRMSDQVPSWRDPVTALTMRQLHARLTHGSPVPR